METQIINEQTVMIYFDNEISESTYQLVQSTVQYIKNQNHSEITEIIPSYRAILIYFDNKRIEGNELLENLELNRLQNESDARTRNKRIIQIPVLYGEEYGPDLAEVAEHNHLTRRSQTDSHSSAIPYLYVRLYARIFI